VPTAAACTIERAPNAALSAVRLLGEADLVDRSRIIMEKPFGTGLASAVSLTAKLHEVFSEDQIFRIDHFLGKEPAQNILAFRFANGLFEPIWNRNFIDHVQIDVPETLGLGARASFYEATGAFRARSWRWSRQQPWSRRPTRSHAFTHDVAAAELGQAYEPAKPAWATGRQRRASSAWAKVSMR
jgi:Glucose-6-phosphate dehydrogenase, NAD binding domain/Glucose-6-phosphate dehydrogenase, C-terminal domain